MKLDWFPFYHNDFFTDEPVRHMTNRHVGAYLKLLTHQWIEGSVPDDLKSLADICGESVRAMSRLWVLIERCFVRMRTRTNRLLNKKMQKIRRAALKRYTRRSKAGKAGAQARWSQELTEDSGDGNGNGNRMATGCDCQVEYNTIEDSTTEEETHTQKQGVPAIITNEKAAEIFQHLASLWNESGGSARNRLRSTDPAKNRSVVGCLRVLSGDPDRLVDLDTAVTRIVAGQCRAWGTKKWPWKPSFDWLFKDPMNVDKILQGDYDGEDDEPKRGPYKEPEMPR